MKSKLLTRVFSLAVSLFMLFTLIPTAAFAEEGVSPMSVLGSGVYHFDAATNLELPNHYDVFPDELVWDGNDLVGTYQPVVPGTEYVGEDGTKYTLVKLEISAAPVETYTFTEFNNLEPVDIPDNAIAVGINYYWDVDTTGTITPDPGDDDEEEGRPTIKNFIYSVDRTVAQNGDTLTSTKNEDDVDVYRVTQDPEGAKSGLTLSYDTSMDMTNLGFAFPGDGSWDLLQANKESIYDTTWVDLVFQFDDAIDVTTVDCSEAHLDSDMFVLKGNSADEWYSIDDAANTLTVHCRWDGATANSINDLDPMIYFNGLKVDLPADWGNADSITIVNGGKVEGRVEFGVRNNTGYVEENYIDIDGGTAGDTFILTVDKESLPGMDKTIVLEDGTEVDKDNVAAGDTVKFQLESNVPENLGDYVNYTPDDPVIVPNSIGDAGTYTLVFHDEMAKELALNEGSFEVMLGDETISEDYYDIVIAPNDGITDNCTFEVTVDLAAMYNNDVIDETDFGVTPITVNYTATLAADTVAGAFTNTAWVVYPDGSSEHDTVTVYTYGIDIFKYDQADDQKGLGGAEFALYGEDDVTVAGDSTVTVNPDAEAIWTGASANGGHATIGGLDEGTYYLVETKAPDGYVKSDTPLKIVIPEDADGTTYMVDVNFANTLIPHTGGMGTTMFTLGGAAILAAAGVLFIYSRKTRKDQEEN